MLIHGWKLSGLIVATSLLTVAATGICSAADNTDPTGLVRVSDAGDTNAIPASFDPQPESAVEPMVTTYPVNSGLVGCEPRTKLGRWWHDQSVRFVTRNTVQSANMNGYWGDQHCQYDWRARQAKATLAAHIRCKFGYFIPTGCCGKGCPPLGRYRMVYAVDPGYFDARDGQVYATQGTGTPVAVPLAPNVNSTYNYGWGIPSSRLTPISRTQPPHYP